MYIWYVYSIIQENIQKILNTFLISGNGPAFFAKIYLKRALTF